MQPDITRIEIVGDYPRRLLATTRIFKNIDDYLCWENQRGKDEPYEMKGAHTMLYMNRRAKIKLIKKICPEYRVENLDFNDYTAQELSEIWQDDDLLDEILCELIEALPNDQYYL
jgi:hypothetical protein